jgi:hypothetical protein
MRAHPQTPRDPDPPDESDPYPSEGIPTTRPAFEPGELARRLEASKHMSTQPPEPTCEMLRDSCRAFRVADLALEAIDDAWADAEKKAPETHK